jgi:hypothetical protein
LLRKLPFLNCLLIIFIILLISKFVHESVDPSAVIQIVQSLMETILLLVDVYLVGSFGIFGGAAWCHIGRIYLLRTDFDRILQLETLRQECLCAHLRSLLLFFKIFDFIISARSHLYIISAIDDDAQRLGLHRVIRVIATVWLLTHLHGQAGAVTVAITVSATLRVICGHRMWMQNFLNHRRLILFKGYRNRRVGPP